MSSKKKFTVVTNGKFHHFDFAAELYKKGLLVKLISTYPYFIAKRYGIGREVFVGLTIFEFVRRFWWKIFNRSLPATFYAKLFTKTALLFIPKNTEVIITHGGYSEEILASKRFKNTIKILDRGSSHSTENFNLNKQAASYHNSEWKELPKSYLERELLEYELADVILVPSTFAYNSFLKNGVNKEKVLLIPYGMSKHRFNNKNTFKDVKEKEANIVLYVGQFSTRKGIGVLVNAMKIVRKTIPNASLWLVGSKHSSLNKNTYDLPWVKIWGVLNGNELVDKYRRASVFCLFSFEDGFGLVLTEALQFGLQVIATENTGAVDLNKKGLSVHLTSVGDEELAAEKIIQCLENPASKHNGPLQNGNIDFSKIYNWEIFCKEFIHFIEQYENK